MPFPKEVSPGDQIRASSWNEIIRALSKDFVPRSTIAGGGVTAARPPVAFPKVVPARTAVATNAGSILVPTAQLSAFSLRDLSFSVTEFTDDATLGSLLFTTKDKSNANGYIRVEPILPGIPYLLQFEGTNPSFGSMMSPKDSSTALEKDDQGNFIAASEPFTGFTDNQLVWAILSLTAGKKPLVRFTLDNALTTSEASESATIVTQYGPGIAADTTATITVHNLLTSTGGQYVFEGDSGDAGYGFWDYGTNYRIIQMECP